MKYWIEGCLPGEGMPPVTSIYLYDELGNRAQSGTTAAELARDLRAAKGGRIELHINSPGGSAEAALRMYEILRSRAADLTTFIDGKAGSGAAIVALAADSRLIHRDGSIFIHEAQSIPIRVALSPAQRSAMHRNVEQVSAAIAAVYAQRTGHRDAAWWRDRMRAETTFDAGEAQRVGLVHGITYDRLTPERLDLHARYLAGAW